MSCMRRSADSMLLDGVAPLTLAPPLDPLPLSPTRPLLLRLLFKDALVLELKEEDEDEDEEDLLTPSREFETPVRSEPAIGILQNCY